MTRVIYEPNIDRDMVGVQHGQSQLQRRPNTGIDGGGAGGDGIFSVVANCEIAIGATPTLIDGTDRNVDTDVIETQGDGTIMVKLKGIYVAGLTLKWSASMDGATLRGVIEWDIGTWMVGAGGPLRDTGYSEADADSEIDFGMTSMQVVIFDEPDASAPNLVSAFAWQDSGSPANAYAHFVVARIAAVADADMPSRGVCAE